MQIKRLEAWSLKVEIDQENAAASLRQLDADIDERHRAPDTALKRIEGNNMHCRPRP
jgi:hypothetical protein